MSLESTCYTVTTPRCVLQRSLIEIPDNEHQRIARYPGVLVRDVETGVYLGDCWRGVACWHWRTVDCRHFGTVPRLRYAVRNIVNIEGARHAA